MHTLILVGLLLAGCDDSDSSDDSSDDSSGESNGESNNGDSGGAGVTDGGAADGGAADGGATAEQGWCGVQQVLTSKCVACHSFSRAAGGLDLETDPYAALVDQPSGLYSGHILVVAGDAGASFLFTKVTEAQAEAEGDPMPPQGGLSETSVTLIRDWIDDGATSDCDEPALHGMEAKLH